LRKIKKYLTDDGRVVYQFIHHDYGLSSDDTQSTGIKYVSVTLNENGDYPFFTIPVHELKEIQDA